MFTLERFIFNRIKVYVHALIYSITIIFICYSSLVFSAVPNCSANNIFVSFGDVSIRNDVSVGDAFGEEIVVESKIKCSSWKEMRMFVDTAVGSESRNKIFKTAIPGVGIQWVTESERGARQRMSIGSVRGLNTEAKYKNTFSLIKTGDIVSGHSDSIIINMKYKQYENIGGSLFSYNINVFSVKEKSCDILTPEFNVSMGAVLKSHFTGKNSAIGERAFNIDVKCKGQPQASITWQGGGTDGVINADTTSSSAGVGIQILDGDNPLEFNKEIALGYIATEKKLFYKAKFYQTSDRVSAGSVNATATFTIDYK
ncbi:fimbrial protein [Yersinia aldovae]|uniref:Fimbrial subunit n=1 Tax=Yersinia aldovae TaxID=29483 RepID=A0ABM9SWP1_YERAL|nr:fimbrial protein [Yersinia aldovae]CNK02165.1 putative fimbrial subunit [Yersinia aldovae]CNL43448.1 putative fimbrial subunit [Yersinia aldovae]